MRRVNRWISVTLAAVWFAAVAPSAAVAQSVVRGPYLQSGTPTGVVVRWRTDVATDSRVLFGNAPGSLTSAVDDAASQTEHEVTLSGLFPNTVYYYAVGTTTKILAGNDPSSFFLTAPRVGKSKPTRIWVLGDPGTADADAAAVRDAYYAFTGTRHTDLWLMLGDNAYPSGKDSEYQAAVFDMYPTMLRKSVLWPTFGSHEGRSANSATQTGPYFDIFTLPRNAEAGGVASGTLVPAMILSRADGRPTDNGTYQKPTEGPSPHLGAVYAVLGSSGHTSGGALNHPAMFVSLNVLGSLVLDVTGDRLDATFLDSIGGIRDTFTIFKDPQTEAESTSAAPGVFAAATGQSVEAKAEPVAGRKCEVKNESTNDKARGTVQVPATSAAPSNHLECKVTSTTPGFMTVAVGDILCVDVNSSANAVTPAATASG